MSFEELYALSPSSSPVAEQSLLSQQLRSARLPPPPTAEELRVALEQFAERSRRLRSQAQPGSSMPSEQVDNWAGLELALRAWLKQPAPTTPLELVEHSQAVLEAELGEDARIYGDIPAELAEAVLARLDRLAVRCARLRPRSRTSLAGPPLVWPVEPVHVTSLFGIRLHPITRERREHLGVDLAARPGQVVSAAAPGFVLRAGWNGSHGLQVELRHDDGVRTRYSHLSRVFVYPGEQLDQGDALGLAGKTGLATGVHLHFELWRDGQPRDPLEELEPMEGELEEVSVLRPQAPTARHMGAPPRG